ncbi:50S ribosomal protein L13 [Leptospira ryugenii]|uniref:Large ribosomal subunit protein uL13 n=1 Tax=Leptospira ryugenii TaxID=1917863 RepID=A0A2P2DY29_9LEPT|nr:50S ribosomal protein L13 [Leptospira ryugenii]GBF49532.1 50S ribosomal protein L13 [Leptospira ryugenii]
MELLSKPHKTPSLKKEEVQKQWYIVDASDKTLGRLASQVASRLRGKHKATFTANQDCGDNIIIINAAKVNVTGRKREQKIYYHHSRYPGGMTAVPFHKLVSENPERILLEAVKGMLPKSKLGAQMLSNCRVFAGAEHNLAAQKPLKLELK